MIMKTIGLQMTEEELKALPEHKQEIALRDANHTFLDECFGEHRWCVLAPNLSDGQIYVYADRVTYTPVGDIVFRGKFRHPMNYQGITKKDDEEATLIIKRENWDAVYKASAWDGGAVSVDLWRDDGKNYETMHNGREA